MRLYPCLCKERCQLEHRKSSSMPPGAYLFQTLWGGFNRGGGGEEGLFKRGSLFHLAKTTVSVLHKELEYKVEKLKYKKLEII